MTRPRHPKPDANQAALCRDLVALGLGFEAWTGISRLSDAECPGDILVKGWHHTLHAVVYQPFEIKTQKGKLTAGQAERRDDVPIARNVHDILHWYGYEAATEPR